MRMRATFATVILGAVVSIAILATALVRVASPAQTVPKFSEVKASWRPSDVRLLDRDGQVIDELRSDPSGRRLQWTRLADVSPAMLQAVVAGEDRRFYHHHGVDYRALLAALKENIFGAHARGASTISMQLVTLLDARGCYRSRPKSLIEKLVQIRSAIMLERNWSKEEVLEAYLNRA